MARYFRVWNSSTGDDESVDEYKFLSEDSIRMVSLTTGIWWVLTQLEPERAHETGRDTAVALLGLEVVEEIEREDERDNGPRQRYRGGQHAYDPTS